MYINEGLNVAAYEVVEWILVCGSSLNDSTTRSYLDQELVVKNDWIEPTDWKLYTELKTKEVVAMYMDADA